MPKTTQRASALSFERMASLAAELEHLLSVLHASPLCQNLGELITAANVVFSACVAYVKANVPADYVRSLFPSNEPLSAPITLDVPWPPPTTAPAMSKEQYLPHAWLEQEIATALSERPDIATALAELQASILAYKATTPKTVHAPHMTLFDPHTPLPRAQFHDPLQYFWHSALLRAHLLSVLFSRWMHRNHLSEWYHFSEPVLYEFCTACQHKTQSIINCMSHGGWPSVLLVHWANVLHHTFHVMCQYAGELLLSPFAVRGNPATATFAGVVGPMAPVGQNPTTHEACEVLCSIVWQSLRCLALPDQSEPAPPCVFVLPHTHGAEYIRHRLASESGLPIQHLPHITQLSFPLPLSALVSRHAGCDP